MPTNKAVLVSIRGRVQGVGYRMWTEREARALGLKGWVRNEPDGSVTALVGGPDEAVARILELFRSGPRSAAVTGVTTQPAEVADLPAGFRQIR
jgi:acylphosphatase